MRTAGPRSYSNFDLLVERHGDGYRARVVNSPSGDAEAIFTAPFSEQELEQLAARLDNSRSANRKMSAPQLVAAKDAGGRLFRSVITPDVNAVLYRAVEEAERQGATGVRVRLHLDGAPELAVLPWELLFDPDPRVNRFLALAERTPLVRYMQLPAPVRPLVVTPPLRVLVLLSAPGDPRYAELDLEREWNRLQDAMAEQIQDGRVAFTRLPRVTLAALQDELAVGDYHVLHYMGHGQFDEDQQNGVLLFESEQGGRAAAVSAETLGTLLHNERTLRLVVVNACEGARGSSSDPYAGTAQTLVRMGIPAVIGMQFEISDDAAIAFARQLYWTIARGWPVDAAVTSARIAVMARGGQVEWANPVLYMRASDGRVFELAEAAAGLTPRELDRHVDVPRVTEVPSEQPVRAGRVDRDVGTEAPRPTSFWRTFFPGRATAFAAALLVIAAMAVLLNSGRVSPPWDHQASPTPSLGAPVFRVTSTIPVTGRPDGVAVDTELDRLFVVSGGEDVVRSFSGRGDLLSVIRVGGQPVDVAADAGLGRIYVTHLTTGTVTVIDSLNGRVLAQIPVGREPIGITADPESHRVLVVNSGSANVTIIDGRSQTVVSTVRVETSPSGVAVHPATGRAYVANLGSNSVSIVDVAAGTVVGSIRLGAAPARVVVDSTRNHLYVSNADAQSVTIIDLADHSVLKTINVGRHPLGLAFAADADLVFVANGESNTVTPIDTRTLLPLDELQVGAGPARLAYQSQTKRLYVTSFFGESVSVIEEVP